MLNPYVSVDCVLLGIDEDQLTVLLTERRDVQGERIGYKLPGSLIYEQEDLDDAAQRVLSESTGLKQVLLQQFRCFGSPSRTANRSVLWCPIDQLPPLPFDHTEIVEAAVSEIRQLVEKEPAIIFGYLPTKFTALQLRHVYEVIFNRKMDVRNFHKKMTSLDYITLTDDMQDGVSHRAARYYRFDKVKYNKHRSKLNK